MQDFLGNYLSAGDKVVCVLGRHLRKSKIEYVTSIGTEFYPVTTTDGHIICDVKIVGLKKIIRSNCLIKIEWQETVK